MNKLNIYVDRILAGVLVQVSDQEYSFEYEPNYKLAPISLTIPVRESIYNFDQFPSALEGLLPEGIMLDLLLKKFKIDRSDLFSQLALVGSDLVGNLTVEKVSNNE
jgi:serine/threonine-protein kinase HipA